MATASRLDGRVAVVTAAAQGIGRAAAQRLRDHGARVHASDLNAAGLEGLEGCSTAGLDATDPVAVGAYFDALPRIDALVHCVGYVHQGTIEECPPDAWRRSAAITLDSAYYVLRAAVPRMKQNGGAIVTIASVASSIKGFPRRAAYGAMKGGLIGLTKSIAADYLSAGIRANAVCPGTVDTPSLHERIAELTAQLGDAEAARRFFIERQPSGRFGTADEIADLCAFLVSDASTFITGQAINVDGGITI